MRKTRTKRQQDDLVALRDVTAKCGKVISAGTSGRLNLVDGKGWVFTEMTEDGADVFSCSVGAANRFVFGAR